MSFALLTAEARVQDSNATSYMRKTWKPRQAKVCWVLSGHACQSGRCGGFQHMLCRMSKYLLCTPYSVRVIPLVPEVSCDTRLGDISNVGYSRHHLVNDDFDPSATGSTRWSRQGLKDPPPEAGVRLHNMLAPNVKTQDTETGRMPNHRHLGRRSCDAKLGSCSA